MKNRSEKPALLVLEDGQVFEGASVGADAVAFAEIVFNTSMTGYQEILTDPSYAGQLVTLTHPHIGNYGVSTADMESAKIQAAGLIVREMSSVPSNHRSEIPLPRWLAKHAVPAIAGIDTRALTRHIRDAGVMMAAVVPGATRDDASRWRRELEDQPGYGARDFVDQVRTQRPVRVICRPHEHGSVIELEPEAERRSDRPHVVVLDFGVKHSILRHLCQRGFEVTLAPSSLDAAAIEALEPDGILISNGPGDPARLDSTLDTIRELVRVRPTYGICLGHQLLARAFGGQTFKLPFGHRGPNQPVQDLGSRRIAMTSQNHGYAVDRQNLPDVLEITHINLNDETVEGFRHRELPVFAVQYHPEAGPGPNDAVTFFDDFLEAVSASQERE